MPPAPRAPAAPTTLTLHKFEPQTHLVPGRAILVVAKRGSGKSFLIKTLMWYYRNLLHYGLVFNATEDCNAAYADRGGRNGFVPDSFVHTDTRPEVLEALVKRQRRLIKQGVPNCDVFLVLDDCAFDVKFFRQKVIQEILLNGRHLRITIICSSQYAVLMPPAIRANQDLVFLLSENLRTNREKLWKHYAGMFPKFEHFDQVVNEITKDYGVLVINNAARSSDISECCFWWKAHAVPPFKMGCPAFWNLHETIYNRNWDQDDDDGTAAPGATAPGQQNLRGSSMLVVRKDGQTRKV